MDRQFLQERIAATKKQIVAYEDALLAIGKQGGVQSYILDTGQSRQTVTRAEIPELNKMLDSLYNRLTTQQARLTGGAVTVAPGW